MSRSQPTLQNPAEHFMEWSGSKGELSWWNKDKQARVPVKLPFTFMVLDELATITGYSKPDKSGFWSNEVRSTVKEELTVRMKSGVRYVGMYKNEQGIVQMPKGARYTKSVYIAHLGGNGDYIMGNLKLSGSALTAWIEFGNGCKPENGTVTLTGSETVEGELGEYHVPKFEYRSSNDVENEAAMTLDKQLQIYLSQYLASSVTADEGDSPWPSDQIDSELGKATPEQIAEFEEKKAEAKQVKRDWTSVGKGQRDDDAGDAESQSLYQSIATAEDIPLDEIPADF